MQHLEGSVRSDRFVSRRRSAPRWWSLWFSRVIARTLRLQPGRSTTMQGLLTGASRPRRVSEGCRRRLRESPPKGLHGDHERAWGCDHLYRLHRNRSRNSLPSGDGECLRIQGLKRAVNSTFASSTRWHRCSSSPFGGWRRFCCHVAWLLKSSVGNLVSEAGIHPRCYSSPSAVGVWQLHWLSGSRADGASSATKWSLRVIDPASELIRVGTTSRACDGPPCRTGCLRAPAMVRLGWYSRKTFLAYPRTRPVALACDLLPELPNSGVDLSCSCHVCPAWHPAARACAWLRFSLSGSRLARRSRTSWRHPPPSRIILANPCCPKDHSP